MRLTGQQAATIADLSDGATVYITKDDREPNAVSFHREEDALTGYIRPDGTFTEWTEPA